MNAEILKPIFDKAVATYPGQRVRVSLIMENSYIPTEPDISDSMIMVGNLYAFKPTMEEALEDIAKKFDPTLSARQKAAAELREKADRIEAGTEPIEAN